MVMIWIPWNPALRDIPADATTLVIGDPKSALNEVAAARIRDYINREVTCW